MDDRPTLLTPFIQEISKDMEGSNYTDKPQKT